MLVMMSLYLPVLCNVFIDVTLIEILTIRFCYPVRTCFGSRSFAVAAPTIWNTLPLDVCNFPSMCCFRRFY